MFKSYFHSDVIYLRFSSFWSFAWLLGCLSFQSLNNSWVGIESTIECGSSHEPFRVPFESVGLMACYRVWFVSPEKNNQSKMKFCWGTEGYLPIVDYRFYLIFRHWDFESLVKAHEWRGERQSSGQEGWIKLLTNSVCGDSKQLAIFTSETLSQVSCYDSKSRFVICNKPSSFLLYVAWCVDHTTI